MIVYSMNSWCILVALATGGGIIGDRQQIVSASWVDPDTEDEFHTTQAYTKGDDREYELVSFVSFWLYCVLGVLVIGRSGY